MPINDELDHDEEEENEFVLPYEVGKKESMDE